MQQHLAEVAVDRLLLVSLLLISLTCQAKEREDSMSVTATVTVTVNNSAVMCSNTSCVATDGSALQQIPTEDGSIVYAY